MIMNVKVKKSISFMKYHWKVYLTIYYEDEEDVMITECKIDPVIVSIMFLILLVLSSGNYNIMPLESRPIFLTT